MMSLNTHAFSSTPQFSLTKAHLYVLASLLLALHTVSGASPRTRAVSALFANASTQMVGNGAWNSHCR